MNKNNSIGSNSKDLKVLNRILVRNLIHKYGPIARYEVAQKTGLTPPTVTTITNEMIKLGVVREVGYGESNGGRRPVMLEFNPRIAYIFAVRLHKGEFVGALFDLAGNIIQKQHVFIDTTEAQEVAVAVGETFKTLLRNARLKRKDILLCGIASPGLVSSDYSIIERSSNLKWEKVPFGSMLSKQIGNIPVCIENISKAAALAEKEYGEGGKHSNLVYINLSIGISAGILINGEIYTGSMGYAGEIGHMSLFSDSPEKCVCGLNGCFEAVCSLQTVMDKIKAAVPEEIVAKHGFAKFKLNFADIIASDLQNVPEVKLVLEQTGKLVGVAVANLVNIFNPELVILGGPLAKAGDCFLSQVNQTAATRMIPEIAKSVKIIRSQMAEEPPLVGAFAIALKKVLAMENWNSGQTLGRVGF